MSFRGNYLSTIFLRVLKDEISVCKFSSKFSAAEFVRKKINPENEKLNSILLCSLACALISSLKKDANTFSGGWVFFKLDRCEEFQK